MWWANQQMFVDGVEPGHAQHILIGRSQAQAGWPNEDVLATILAQPDS